jgi:hypothetical protein
MSASQTFFKQYYRCAEHALPYRVIFAEFYERRSADLEKNCRAEINDPLVQDWLEQLQGFIVAAENAYADLYAAKQIVDDAARQTAIDAAVAECVAADRPLKRILHKMKSSAVCLSGGGVRSATFSLGVLEGLARVSLAPPLPAPAGSMDDNPLLPSMDYLSTVSGGGYIGSWLMAWSKRLPGGWGDAIGQLAVPGPTAGDPEPSPIRHLRSYSSYLSPQIGLTLDALTLVIIVARNLILNWLIFAPSLLFLLSLPIGSHYLMMQTAHWTACCVRDPISVMLGVATLLLVVAVLFGGRGIIQQISGVISEGTAPDSTKELLRVALPVWLAGWLLADCWIYRQLAQGKSDHIFNSPPFWILSAFAFVPMLVVGIQRVWNGSTLDQYDDELSPNFKLAAQNLAHTAEAKARIAHVARNRSRIFWRRWAALAAAIPAGLTFGVLFWGAAVYLSDSLQHSSDTNIAYFLTVFGMPLAALALMIGMGVQEGMVSGAETEGEREWWSRAAGLILGGVLKWILWSGVAVAGAFIIRLGETDNHVTLASAWSGGLAAVLGYFTARAGGSAATSSGLGPVKLEQLSKPARFLAKNGWLLQVISAIVLLALGLVFASLAQYWRNQLHAENRLIANLLLVLAYAASALIANLYVNVNTFSLHAMYRMRLVRAYLGASNTNRRPNPFTNFDPRDDLYLADVARPDFPMPLHLINANLNMVDTQVLAWGQRKGESFTMSRLFCGSWRGAFVPTTEYAGRNHGMKLGTAMAISGAAFNPNMGYNSSPLVTFIMTLFNARLGWWLPNPAYADPGGPGRLADLLLHNSPSFALWPLVNEALGRTDARFKWIQLSDGGHFENLALYEMVLRRVKTIIVVDADADAGCKLDDLGNAIRKIQIDLGIPIVFPNGIRMHAGVNSENRYCATAVIKYSYVDKCADGHEDEIDGQLIYIKPQLNGSEPRDILAYEESHPTFPHETTVNQFFNESQFESYRHLGSFVVDALTSKPPTARTHPSNSMPGFAEFCEEYLK